MNSGLERWSELRGEEHWHVRLTDRDAMHMSQERLEMIQDGFWLIEQALRGEHTEGPLTLPKTGLPIRA